MKTEQASNHNGQKTCALNFELF